jgi:hypothetical protein
LILSVFIHKYDDLILFYILFHRPFASLTRATENAEVIIILFSVDPAYGTGRTENNNNHALRAFSTQNYRVAVDFFMNRINLKN